MRTLADAILDLASVKWLDWLGLILSVAVALATIISGAIGSHSLFHLGYEPTFRDIEVCLSLSFCFLLLQIRSFVAACWRSGDIGRLFVVFPVCAFAILYVSLDSAVYFDGFRGFDRILSHDLTLLTDVILILLITVFGRYIWLGPRDSEGNGHRAACTNGQVNGDGSSAQKSALKTNRSITATMSCMRRPMATLLHLAQINWLLLTILILLRLWGVIVILAAASKLNLSFDDRSHMPVVGLAFVCWFFQLRSLALIVESLKKKQIARLFLIVLALILAAAHTVDFCAVLYGVIETGGYRMPHNLHWFGAILTILLFTIFGERFIAVRCFPSKRQISAELSGIGPEPCVSPAKAETTADRQKAQHFERAENSDTNIFSKIHTPFKDDVARKPEFSATAIQFLLKQHAYSSLLRDTAQSCRSKQPKSAAVVSRHWCPIRGPPTAVYAQNHR